MWKVYFVLATALLTSSLVLSWKPPEGGKVKRDDAAMKTKELDDQGDKNDMDLITAMSTCNESFRIEMSYLTALNESGSFPDEVDKTPKCFIRCVLENTKIVSAEGVFDPAQAAAVLSGLRTEIPSSDLENMAEECSRDRNESCKCEKSYQFLKCIVETEIEKYDKHK